MHTFTPSAGHRGRTAVTMVVAAVLALAGLPVAHADDAPDEPAGAQIEVSDAALAGEPKLRVEGTIAVVVIEGADAGYRYSVSTAAGASVPIDGPLPAAVTSGSSFSGAVAVPQEAVAVVRGRFRTLIDRSAEQPIESDTAAGEAILAASTAPLRVVEASIDPPVARALVPMAHTVDVVVLDGTRFSDADVANVVSGLSSYWSTQSGGLIPSITRSGPIRRYDSPVIRPGSCGDIFRIWDEAARKFGKSDAADYYRWAGEHLVVIQPPGCGSGVATIGFGVHEGGVILADVSNIVDLHILAHEFGHNIGLGHSNTQVCSGTTRVDGTAAEGCAVYEYEDYYDVMSGAFISCSPCITTNKLAALDATQKAVLGFFPPGSLQTVSASGSRSLAPASAVGGLRALRVVDPISHETYYVEYRSGGGADARTFYTLASASLPRLRAALGLGVRVLKLGPRVNGAAPSIALAQALVAGYPKRRLALGAGQSFIAPDSGLTITVTATSPTTASVDVTLLTLPKDIARISGPDRYDVAAKVSQRAFPATAPVVYLATGEKFPDALSAASAAVEQGGPLLLTAPSSLPAAVGAEISRLEPKRIVVVGGTRSVSAKVVGQLQALRFDGVAPEVVRIAGADRYATSAAIVDYAFDNASVAYVVTGQTFPDALSAAAAGASTSAPVLLVNGAKSSPGAMVTGLLTSLGVSEVKIGGGTSSVSAAIQASLDASFGTVTRLAGADRFAASRAVNNDAIVASETVYLSTGLNYPDALAGAALAGRDAAPLYLTQSTCVPRGVLADLSRLGATRVVLLGGPNSLSPGVLALAACGF